MTNNKNKTTIVLAVRIAVPTLPQPEIDSQDRQSERLEKLLHTCVSAHSGHELDFDGATFHAEFRSALNAIDCANAIVARLQANDNIAIGISTGGRTNERDIVSGSAVESANSLCALARANEVLIAASLRGQARRRPDLTFNEFRPAPGQALSEPAYILSDESVGKTGFAFIQELIRRRVFRAAGAYILVSWILVQVASIVFPEFDAPRWAMRVLIILLTVGFPLAVILAWSIDFTARGLKQTPHSEYSRNKGRALQFSIVGVSTVLSVAVLWWVWTDYLEPETQKPERATPIINPVVAVSTPNKIAGADDIDWLGEGVANLLRDDLAESRHVIVLSQSRWNAIASKAESSDDLRSVALNVGIDYLVEGDYLQSPNGLIFNVRVEDLENGIVIAGPRLEEADAAGVIAATPGVALNIKRALQIPLEKDISQIAADFFVQNMDAYEAYIAGVAYLTNFDYQLAEQSFDAALAIAPDYHMARYRRAMVLQSIGRSDAALLELNAIPEDADLTERERLYIEGAKSHFTAELDPARSIEIYSKLVKLYPYDIEGGHHLANSYWLNYQEDEAIDEFRRLARLHSYDSSAWMALGEQLLDVGQLDEAEQALQKYVGMAPEDHFAVALLGNLAQLRGQYAESIEFYNRSLMLKSEFAVATLGLARSRYMEGDGETAESLWSQLIDDTDQAAGYRIDAAFDLTGVLRGQGRFDESSVPLQKVADIVRQEGPRTAMMLSTLGLTALEVGDYKKATLLIDQAIAESPGVATRYLFARGVLELRLDQLDQLQNTTAEIQALALPADDPDRTEDKAASYLLGMSSLQQGHLESAKTHLLSTTSKEGYTYTLYTIGLAQLYIATGELSKAAAAAERATTASDPGDLRLDLELDRAKAKVLRADIQDLLAAQ